MCTSLPRTTAVLGASLQYLPFHSPRHCEHLLCNIWHFMSEPLLVRTSYRYFRIGMHILMLNSRPTTCTTSPLLMSGCNARKDGRSLPNRNCCLYWHTGTIGRTMGTVRWTHRRAGCRWVRKKSVKTTHAVADDVYIQPTNEKEQPCDEPQITIYPLFIL